MNALSVDRPSSNPQDDLFRHAPFADPLTTNRHQGVGRLSQRRLPVVINYLELNG